MNRPFQTVMSCLALSVLANELATDWAVYSFLHKPMMAYHQSGWDRHGDGIISGFIGGFILSFLPNFLERRWRIRRNHILLWIAGPLMGWIFFQLKDSFEFLDYASWFVVIGGMLTYAVIRREAL